MNTLVMLVSTEHFRFARMALQTAIKYCDFDEAILAFNSATIAAGWPDKLKTMLPNKIVQVLKGANTRDQVARVRFECFDRAHGEWIACDHEPHRLHSRYR